mmetsp:Transcript_8794/g.18606  ORF Transcript_8794/g.18606 Transcript_8794/m.18606 type:complete len:254 (+) Transcript_8794:739-1500(+)
MVDFAFTVVRVHADGLRHDVHGDGADAPRRQILVVVAAKVDPSEGVGDLPHEDFLLGQLGLGGRIDLGLLRPEILRQLLPLGLELADGPLQIALRLDAQLGEFVPRSGGGNGGEIAVGIGAGIGVGGLEKAKYLVHPLPLRFGLGPVHPAAFLLVFLPLALELADALLGGHEKVVRGAASLPRRLGNGKKHRVRVELHVMHTLEEGVSHPAASGEISEDAHAVGPLGILSHLVDIFLETDQRTPHGIRESLGT